MPVSLALLVQAAPVSVATDGIIAFPPEFFAGQRPNNAREMLERLPGFVLDEGTAVRGFEGAAGNVLIDGRRPASKTDSLYDILTRIPAGKVARIELVRGGAAGVDMQGKTVLANVVLKTGAGSRAQVGGWTTKPVSDSRTAGGLELQASGDAGGRNWELSAELARAVVAAPGDGPGRLLAADGRVLRSSVVRAEHDGEYLLASGGYELPLAGGRLRINGRLLQDKQKIEEDDVGAAGQDAVGTDQAQVTEDWELGGSFRRSLSSVDDLEIVALRQAGAIDYSSFRVARSRQAFENSRRTRETVARAVFKHRWSPALWSELGAETARNRLASRTAFEVDGADVPLPAGDVEVREERDTAFAKAGWKLAPAWNLDGALHYERSKIVSAGDVILGKRLQYLKPRATLTWSARPTTQLRLRMERDVGQLDFDDFVAQASLDTGAGVTAGNPDLVPERAWTAEAVLEQRFWDRGALTLTVRGSRVQDVVDRGPVFSPSGVFDRPANIGDGRKETLRLDLTLPLARLGAPGAQLKGLVTRRWSRVDDPTTGERRRISGLAPVDWEVHFTQDLPTRAITWGASLYGGWQRVYYRFDAVEALKLDPYLMAFVEWRPRRDLDVRVELMNITERGRRRTTVTWPGPRDEGGAAVVSDRNPHFGRLVYLRVRKAFGP